MFKITSICSTRNINLQKNDRNKRLLKLVHFECSMKTICCNFYEIYKQMLEYSDFKYNTDQIYSIAV